MKVINNTGVPIPPSFQDMVNLLQQHQDVKGEDITLILSADSPRLAQRKYGSTVNKLTDAVGKMQLKGLCQNNRDGVSSTAFVFMGATQYWTVESKMYVAAHEIGHAVQMRRYPEEYLAATGEERETFANNFAEEMVRRYNRMKGKTRTGIAQQMLLKNIVRK